MRSDRTSTGTAEPGGPAGTSEGTVVWRPGPEQVEGGVLARFASGVRTTSRPAGTDYGAVWRWSVDEPADFWSAVAEDAAVPWATAPTAVLAADAMPGAVWFPGGTLNYVDVALRRRDDGAAIVFQEEDAETTTVSWAELADLVRRLAAGLRRLGVGRGDRVAAYAPNRVETIAAFLATASLGAVWTVASPDFGEASVVDRFSQVAPTVLLVVTGYSYGGRRHDRTDVVQRLVKLLPSVEHVVALPGQEVAGALDWSVLDAPTDEPLEPVAVPFDHPLWIVYTSGTTGRPKAIVHGHGGVVLEHHKLLRLQLELTPQDRFFWFSTTGWVMWNILVGGLLVGTTIVVYDGSPTHPDTARLWRIAESTEATFLGLSAGYIQAAMRDGQRPGSVHDLSRVRSVGVTGSPLPAAGYGWLTDEVGEVFIASICGGTDVATAFLGCTPTLPVRAGYLQAACLGVDAVALDGAGEEVVGETGELVIRRPIPSMPLYFWGDDGGERYRESYFGVYPGRWRHGDWVRFEPDRSCIVFGRSDATLNRGGVRMGTGDFYGVLDALPSVARSVVVDTTNADMPEGRLLLLVQATEGTEVGPELVAGIRSALRTSLSPRHNPDDVIVVERLPMTLNGKRLEVPAKRLFQGAALDEVVDPSAVDDPQALDALARAATEWRRSAGLPVGSSA